MTFFVTMVSIMRRRRPRERREEMFVKTSNKMYLVSKVAEVRAEW